MTNILHEDFIMPFELMEISDIIQEQMENKPKKTNPLYKEWKKKMNILIDEDTKLRKFKAWKSIY